MNNLDMFYLHLNSSNFSPSFSSFKMDSGHLDTQIIINFYQSSQLAGCIV